MVILNLYFQEADVIRKNLPNSGLKKTTGRQTLKEAIKAAKRRSIRDEKKESIEKPKVSLNTSVKKRKPDIFIRIVRWLSVIGWLILIAIAVLIQEARPDEENFWNGFFHTKPRRTWDYDLLIISYELQMLLFGLCIFALLVNLVGYTKYKDKFSISIILLGTFSMFGTLTYIYKYILNP